MNPRSRGLAIGLGGCEAGTLVGQVVDLATLPKVALACLVSLSVSLILLWMTADRKAA